LSGEGSRRGRGGHSADQQQQQHQHQHQHQQKQQQQLGGRNSLAAVPEEEETAGSSISVRWVNRGVWRVRRVHEGLVWFGWFKWVSVGRIGSRWVRWVRCIKEDCSWGRGGDVGQVGEVVHGKGRREDSGSGYVGQV
jgi:hypothetical protein